MKQKILLFGFIFFCLPITSLLSISEEKKFQWFQAIENKDLDKVNNIINRVKDNQDQLIEILSLKNDHEETGLVAALYKDNYEIAKAILEGIEKIKNPNIRKKIINTQTKEGYWALNIALFPRKYEFAENLIKIGADPNIKNSISGNTPLHSLIPNKDQIKFLLEHGANPNIKNHYGETPLIRTVLVPFPDKDIAEVVKLFLEKGANSSIKNNKGKTALDYAKIRSLPETIEILEKTIKKN
ncbi:MAG: ankyrin repeat domain-containing protein [Candidatus Babeliales bacterium]